MALTDTLGRIGATLAAMFQTRLELAAVELEEESLRFLSYLLLGLLSLFLCGIALLLFAFVVIVLFWDSYRIAASLGMACAFALLGGAVALNLRNKIRDKPRLLGSTMSELGKDIDFVKSAAQRAVPTGEAAGHEP